MNTVGSGPKCGLDAGTLAGYRWDDVSIPATIGKRGVLNKPDFDYTDLGLLFPQNDPSEKIYIVNQMPHKKALGTAIRLHIHYIQTGSDVPNFKADYRYYNNGETIPAFTTIQTDDGSGAVFEYTSGSVLQILPFPEIEAPENESLSANLDLIIYRDDNIVTGDILLKYVDFHCQFDSAGSRLELSK